MTKRKVLAPMIRCHLRHCSRPRPSKVLASRMAMSTAQRARYSRKMAWKRITKVAFKHGFEGARERILAGQGWRVCASASPRGGQCPGSSPRVSHAEGLGTGMHSNLFVTLPYRFAFGQQEAA